MTTALYRRYRPETFEDVIGQEHVTEPLMTALRKNRVNHAYLFSGPRGCGKTTSARILARCLNCAEGPTATPCGQCESCRDLARNGAGSLDVIEMDAASHGGVDHARDLRERATFAPVRDRYKIFIIDEAHMVTREGFNALLKIVEEPPEHVKFIFATTEPSKVLTTIRSRTHHYPFRLVPPEPLMRYLEQLCQEEGVTTEPGVLSLVVRAGGGSVRDSLSVLDQLMAGSDERGLTYDLAVALLGYTHAALLDDVVDAFAAGDAATVFSSVDRVVQTGQDPRRFVEDLLERFRDLVVVNAVPDSAANILHGMPTDQINRLRNQATQLGAAELSRSADITNEALNEMTGATSPQLHLELLCARILLPSADHTTRGITSRVDRLERRLSIPRGAGIRQSAQDGAASAPGAEPTPLPPSGAPEPVHDAAPARTPRPSRDAAGPEASSAPGASFSPQPAAPGRAADPVGGNSPADESGEETVETGPAPSRPVRQDGSEPGRPAFETPDVAEPSDPQDESEEPQGSEHPAAADPVPEDERGPGAEHPPADGTTTDVEAGQSETAASPAPTGQQDRATSSPAARQDAPSPAGQPAPDLPSERGPGAAGAPREPSAPSDVTSGELELLRSSWPEIVSALAEIRRVAWAITVRGTPISFENNTLRIAFEGDGDIMNFPRFEGDVRTAIQNVVGLDCAVEAVRPGDTRGRQGDQDAGGPPHGPGRGPGQGRGPGSGGGPGSDRGGPSGSPGSGRGGRSAGPERHSGAQRGEDSPSSETPDYFREPEGFGVNRRRTSETTPAPTPDQTQDAAGGQNPRPAAGAWESPEGEQDQSGTEAGAPEHAHGQGQGRGQDPDRSQARSSQQPQGRSRPEGRTSSASADDDEPVTSWSVAAIPQPGDSAGDTGRSETPATDEGRTGTPGSTGGGAMTGAEGPAAAPAGNENPGAVDEAPAPGAFPSAPAAGSPHRPSGDSASERPDPSTRRAAAQTPGTGTAGVPNDAGTAPGASAGPSSARHGGTDEAGNSERAGVAQRAGNPRGAERSAGSPHESQETAPRGPSYDRGPEYWSPEEAPPPPEDEPPADMYDELGPVPSSSRRSPSPAEGDGPAPGQTRGAARAEVSAQAPPAGRTGGGSSRGQTAAAPGTNRPSWRERHAAAIAAAGRTSTDMAPPSTRAPGVEEETFVPGADDESLEDSSLYGRAAIERILGGMLIDERAHDSAQ